MYLVNENNGKILADEMELADTFWKRFRGLMFRRELPRGKALLFKMPKPRRYSIHMFFVRFPIDLVYLDSNFKVVELHEKLKPWHVYRPKKISNYLVELPVGMIKRSRVEIGHKLLTKTYK